MLTTHKRAILILLIVCFFTHIVSAQNVAFIAQSSADKIGLEDQVQVTFTLENIQNPQIQEPSFQGFKRIAGPYQSQSSQISFNGNQKVQSVAISLTYILQPTQIGTFTIAPIKAQDNEGHTYQSNAIKISVVKGSLVPQRSAPQSQDPFAAFDDAFFDDPFFGGGHGGQDPFAAIRQQQAHMQQLLQQMQQQMQQAQSGGQTSLGQLPNITEKELGKNVFVKVIVDKHKAYVGEQINVTYKMYTRIPMQAQISKLPSLNGFWTQDFEIPKDQKPQQETLDGVNYSTFILKKSALFPQQVGSLTLDPSEIVGVANIADRGNPWGRDVQFKLQSKSDQITVLPLPLLNQPKNFSSAVGSNFSLKVALDTNQITTNGSANLTIDIFGTGNIKLIQAPKLNLPNGLEYFDPIVKDTITGKSTTISGHKIFTYALSASIAGDFDIDSLSFSYFNIESNKYVTLKSPKLKLHVIQGKTDSKNQNSINQPTKFFESSYQSLEVKNIPSFWIKTIWYWCLYLISLGSIYYLYIRKKRSNELASNTSLFKNKYANKIAIKRLKKANQLLDQKQTISFYEEISKAIWLYLSDKLTIPLSLLSKDTTTEALVNKNIDPMLIQKIQQVIDHCAFALYAPSNASEKMKETYQQTIDLIGELEIKIKK